MCKPVSLVETPTVFNEARAVLASAWLDDLELRRTRRPTNSDYVRMVNRRRRYQMKLVDDLKSGEINIDEFSRYFEDGLRRSHVNAAVMGRQRAGDFADETEVDEIFGFQAADQDSGFFRAFVQDLRNGRYGAIPELDDVAVKRRALMYVDKARATANEAMALASPVDSSFEWVTLQDERTCATCPVKAAHGPYDARMLQIIGHPGEGQDDCLTSCLCVIVRQDGVVGFGYVPMLTLKPSPARETVPA